MKKAITLFALSVLSPVCIYSQTITIDPSSAGRQQVMDGFGAFASGSDDPKHLLHNLMYEDAMFSIIRVGLTPTFTAPYSTNDYNSPFYGGSYAFPGPDNNNVRTYTGASDYSRSFNGVSTPMAIMDTSITHNITLFDFTSAIPEGQAAQAGLAMKAQLGDFKLYGSIWSPAPWLKELDGNTFGASWGNIASGSPQTGTKFPFIWGGNFAGGKLDVTDSARSEFFDGVQNTSALTQFARGTAAYVKGFQDKFGVPFYAISIQNELDYEEWYHSCFYPLASGYIAALKAVRAEFNKYPDLKNIKILGPEDDMPGDAGNPYGLWMYGNPGTTSEADKNLDFLAQIATDTAATSAIGWYCIHGYTADGISSTGIITPTMWQDWANGWTTSPAAGLPSTVNGFEFYKKKSWMTESSGEDTAWLSPSTGFPNTGAFILAPEIHMALTAGRESAYIYWDFTDGTPDNGQTLTDTVILGNSPKYNAFKHFSRYIRPNAVRLNTTVSGGSDLLASSYIHDENKTLTIVVINSSASAQTVTVDVPSGLAFSVPSFEAYTSSNNSYWKSSTLTVSGGAASITIPGYGVSTLYGGNTSTGIKSYANNLFFQLYPNPANKSVSIQTDGTIAIESLTVYSVNGAVISLMEHIGAASYTMNTDALAAGLYFIKVTGTNGGARVQKFVVNH